MPSTVDVETVCMAEPSGDSTDRVSGFIFQRPEGGFIIRLRLGARRNPGCWPSVRPSSGQATAYAAATRYSGSDTMACKSRAVTVLSRHGDAASSLRNAGLAQR